MSPIYILHLHLATFCIVHKICERDIIPSKQSTFEFISIPLTPCVWRTWTTQCCGGSRSGSTCGFPAQQIVVVLFSSCSGSSTTNSARERFHVVQSQQSTKIWMNEDKQMHGVQMHHMQAPAGSRIFNPGISGTGFCKIPGFFGTGLA